ncbi:MAG TPA: AMIN domain-containing protein, partial [Candidatus Acidoferrales bacterium]|nr:AMIN domain-containing protein [Candidatus Acidoferrales bacterium]
MNRTLELRTPFAKRTFPVLTGIALVLFICIVPARAAANIDKAGDARQQFANAVRMRTSLEGYLEKDRSVSDYKKTIDAYQKVYDISSEAEEAPAALIAEAELYEEMGHLYDQKYYDAAIKTYLSLLDQYPSGQYRTAALFGIGQIQQDDQNKPKEAQATFRDFLKRFPRSQYADDARKALKEIAAGNSGKSEPATESAAATPDDQAAHPAMLNVTDDPAVAGTVVQPREDAHQLSVVKNLQTTNTHDAARMIIALDNTIDFQSARIAAPDRIYFNLSRATLGSRAAHGQFDTENGLIHSLRIAQNRPDVVRVVLDAPDAKDYTAYLLSKPYRLVIDVSTRIGTLPNRQVGMVISPNTGAHAATTTTVAATASQPHETPVSLERAADVPPSTIVPPSPAKPTGDGDTSLTRALGLKIHRIVIDAGHGGHDTGTIGPHGLMEKDLCLDVALRL